MSIVGEPGCAWMALWSGRLEVWGVSDAGMEKQERWRHWMAAGTVCTWEGEYVRCFEILE